MYLNGVNSDSKFIHWILGDLMLSGIAFSTAFEFAQVKSISSVDSDNLVDCSCYYRPYAQCRDNHSYNVSGLLDIRRKIIGLNYSVILFLTNCAVFRL